jgi:poly-beta-hydroxyalkanoate depolymerase
MAAQDQCPNIPPAKRRHYVQAGVGHYGVFSGKRWDREVYPVVRDFVYLHNKVKKASP